MSSAGPACNRSPVASRSDISSTGEALAETDAKSHNRRVAKCFSATGRMKIVQGSDSGEARVFLVHRGSEGRRGGNGKPLMGKILFGHTRRSYRRFKSRSQS